MAVAGGRLGEGEFLGEENIEYVVPTAGEETSAVLLRASVLDAGRLTNVTEEGVKGLKKALPKARVNR